ncbi:MAG: efflux RND transporter permease subunit [Candidatus Palauibacterales bacterium]|nr:efflux RND transporter permease subunit [Candidatus Palauibacterales bacterium]
MIRFAVRRPVATAAIYAAVLALGVYSFQYIPVQLLPDVSYPRLTVTARWAGASPETMEARVTSRLEAAAQEVDGVRSVSSESSITPRGSAARARITVEFDRDARMRFSRFQLAERVSALRSELPSGVFTRVEQYVPEEVQGEATAFLSYQLHGPFTFARLSEIARQELRPAVTAVDGVAGVEVRGDVRREVMIELDRQRVRDLGIRASDLRTTIGALSEPRPVGSVRLAGRETSMAVRARVESVSELRDLRLTGAGGTTVRLGQVAEIRDHAAERSSYHRVNGDPTISVVVGRQPGSNALDVSDRVKTIVDSTRADLPGAVRVELDQDRSEEIRAELTDLRLRALAAAAVILLVLALFLRNTRAVISVYATIGFSVLIAVNLLFAGDFTLNVLTLAGLAWGFGLVVDNGIVVQENIDRRRRGALSPPEAAVTGARQVALPVVAATATTAVVLVPFLFLQGELRIYYRPLAWAVGFSILASLFVAFTFVPAMAGNRGGEAGDGPSDPGEGVSAETFGEDTGRRTDGEPLYRRVYRGVLDLALDHPVAVALLCAGALYGSWRLFDDSVVRGVEWASYWGQDTHVQVRIQYPRGAGLDRTDRLAREYEQTIAGLSSVQRYETQVQPRWASIRVSFPDSLERTGAPVAVKERLVNQSYRYSGPEIGVYGFGPAFSTGGGGSGPNYSVDLYGYSYLQLEGIARGLASRLERFTRVREVDPNASGQWYRRDRAPEYFLQVDRERLSGHDLTVQELLVYVSRNIRGSVGERRVRIGGDEVRYALKLSGYRDFSLSELRELRVPTTDGGTSVRLASVADVREREVLSRIVRERQQYRRTVAWEFRGPRKLGNIVRDAAVEATDLPPGYRIETEGSRFQWEPEQRTQVWWAVGAAVLLIYMVTAALFESLLAPLAMLLTLPLALVGVFLIFVAADATFTRTAYIGAIMMGGIVVNNAILIVYHIGELRERLPDREAILTGTLERVRPILMTTLTTVLGLLPLVLFAESQDENIWNALALATIGGLISSAFLVLVAVPVAYRWLVARPGGEGA